MRTGREIRQQFIKYFEDKGHRHVKSASLVPYNDPTLLFTNAGMNQFKDVFLGIDKRDYNRATTSQKCVRAGGKHNDLETVGKTARHHTFFEMLGNFSFGDYFKKDAIDYAWSFLTENLGLPAEQLYITVYLDDDEAFDLWQARTGFPAEKILRLGEKDNFWQMGDVGPCGPCSEIHYDRGAEYACDHPDGCILGVCDCDRWLEIWNLVFMQFNRDESGQLTPLPNPSIDTGMGLERITSILQGVNTNYDTDLFTPLLAYVETLSGQQYHKDQRGFPFRVIADHARACTFLIADGVLPSNEGRGYVLRRILRRAVRLGKSIGLNDPFLHRFPEKVCDIMGEDFPEIVEQRTFIENVIRQEEERFLQTLQDGLKRVEQTIDELKAQNDTTIKGTDAFMFYDTYGFPIDLTRDIAEEHGLEVDIDGFDAAMAKQRQMSKDARSNVDVWDLAKVVSEQYPDSAATRFYGYDDLGGKSTIVGILIDGVAADQAYDVSASVMVDATPFYAQGGGQIGDSGKFYGDKGVFQVENTFKLPDGKFIHEGYIDGALQVGEPVRAEVAAARRQAIARNHTATHLLHYALREVLGDQVHQAGSLVDATHLRFDFSFPNAVSKEQLREVQQKVNEMILRALPVTVSEMSIEEAKATGHMALFGEKYGDIVRCVDAGDESKELCGGTHVHNVSEIGLFMITSEGAVSAGVRRIEAVSGLAAYAYVQNKIDILDDVTAAVKVTKESEIMERLHQNEDQLRQAKKELKRLKAERATEDIDEQLKAVKQLGDVNVLALMLTADSMDALREAADRYRDRLQNALIVLGAVDDETGQVMLVSTLTKDDIRNRLHAGKIIKDVAALVGGKGGGRPDMAQAGGSDADKLPDALDALTDIVRAQLK